MDEVFARRDMIAPARLKALSVKSDMRGAVRLGGHAGALAVTGAALWLTWGSWLAVPFFIAHGVLINFLYAGQHEFSHSTVFRTKKLNEIFGRLFGFILLYPRDFDQIQHFAHHRYTQVWEKDGELARDRYTLDLLSALGARADLLVHARPAHPPLLSWHRHRALYPGGPQGGRDPRGALAPCGLRRHRRALHRDGKLDRGEALACCRCW